MGTCVLTETWNWIKGTLLRRGKKWEETGYNEEEEEEGMLIEWELRGWALFVFHWLGIFEGNERGSDPCSYPSCLPPTAPNRLRLRLVGDLDPKWRGGNGDVPDLPRLLSPSLQRDERRGRSGVGRESISELV